MLASRNASFYENGIGGLLLAPLKWLGVGVMLLFGLLVAAWVIDGLFVFQVWPDGILRLRNILEEELARTTQMYCWCGDLHRRAVGTANSLYSLIFRATGIHDMNARFAENTALSIPDTIVRNGYLANFEGIRVAMLGTQLIGVRLATMVAALPLMALTYGVAMTDGITQRAIRRVSGGRESSSIYHRAKYLQLALLVTSATIFLLWPSTVDLLVICSIAAGIAAVLVRVQWCYYKKHL